MTHQPPPPPPLFAQAQPVPPSDPHVREQDRAALTGQNAAILAMLRKGPVTPAMALEQIGCHRLAARIRDLRKAGYAIDGEYTYGTRVMVYTLAQPAQAKGAA
jgi:hypothetical protein